jgi:protein O-GlcNAc transferase
MSAVSSHRSSRAKERLANAFAAHRAGRLKEAESGYLAVLQIEGRSTEALNLLGALRVDQGRFDQAIELFKRSLAIEQRQFFAHNSLGYALHARKRHPEAVEHYDKAIALKQTEPATHNNRGNALKVLNRHQEALESYARAIALDVRCGQAYVNRAELLKDLARYGEALADYEKSIALGCDSASVSFGQGVALQETGRLVEAIASFDRTIAFEPASAEAFNNRGNALAQLGQHQQALRDYDEALRLRPQYPQALNNRGNVLNTLGRASEALDAFRRAIAFEPTYVEAHANRAAVLRDLCLYSEALAAYDHVVALDPGNANGHYHRALILNELKRFDAATASFNACIALKPRNDYAFRNRALALRDCKRFEEALESIERTLELSPEFPEALGFRMSIKAHICDWEGLSESRAAVAEAIARGRRAAVPFTVVTDQSTSELQRRCAEIYVRDRFPPRDLPPRASVRPAVASNKIRIAYVSADFHSHATAYLMAGVFEHHDREHFEVTAVSLAQGDRSVIRQRIAGAFGRFVDAQRMSDRAVAELLRDNDVDIAVDLKGFTKDARTGIFAFRPAPLQVSYLGYPGTMGADFIDYLIADRIVIPERDQPFYSEKIVYLPDTYQCTDSRRAIADCVPGRAAAGLPEHGFVFCSFGHNYKITPDMFAVWMRLLQRTEGAVLWLLESNPVAARNLRREAERRGVAQDRLVFAPLVPQAEHLARHRLADLFLDTLPCGAHTTASDALWTGLPVLTCEGETFAGRVASSLLSAIGLPEMVTRSIADYEALALQLAHEPGILEAIRAKLAKNRETYPLFDTARFTRHLESAFAQMVGRRRNGEPPASFAVEPVFGLSAEPGRSQ